MTPGKKEKKLSQSGKQKLKCSLFQHQIALTTRCLQMFKVMQLTWMSIPKKHCTSSDKSNLPASTDNILKGAFYFMLGVPLIQTWALQLSWPIWTQTQTNLKPTASDRVWVTRCNTFSSDLSLIEYGRFRHCVASFSCFVVWHGEGKSKCQETSQPTQEASLLWLWKHSLGFVCLGR